MLYPMPSVIATMSNIDALIRRWQAGDERAAEAIYNQFDGSDEVIAVRPQPA